MKRYLNKGFSREELETLSAKNQIVVYVKNENAVINGRINRIIPISEFENNIKIIGGNKLIINEFGESFEGVKSNIYISKAKDRNSLWYVETSKYVDCQVMYETYLEVDTTKDYPYTNILTIQL